MWGAGFRPVGDDNHSGSIPPSERKSLQFFSFFLQRNNTLILINLFLGIQYEVNLYDNFYT